jgi:hypothetical protein
MNITKPCNYRRFCITTAGVVMVINMVSKICVMGIQHAVLMLPIATSEVHVGLMGRRHYKFRIIVNVSYISYKHSFIKAKVNFLQVLVTSLPVEIWFSFHSEISNSFPRFWSVSDEVYFRDASCALN